MKINYEKKYPNYFRELYPQIALNGQEVSGCRFLFPYPDEKGIPAGVARIP
jgi:hypothetical protein